MGIRSDNSHLSHVMQYLRLHMQTKENLAQQNTTNKLQWTLQSTARANHIDLHGKLSNFLQWPLGFQLHATYPCSPVFHVNEHEECFWKYATQQLYNNLQSHHLVLTLSKSVSKQNFRVYGLILNIQWLVPFKQVIPMNIYI